jgi:hypothetical protein
MIFRFILQLIIASKVIAWNLPFARQDLSSRDLKRKRTYIGNKFFSFFSVFCFYTLKDVSECRILIHEVGVEHTA